MVEIMRANTVNSINENPTSITIKRVTTSIVEGAKSVTPSTLPAQTVRLYKRQISTPKEIANLGGNTNETYYSMVAPHTANIKKEDTFKVDDLQFTVREIISRKYKGQLISLTCRLVGVCVG